MYIKDETKSSKIQITPQICLLYTFKRNLMSVVCDFLQRESLDLKSSRSLVKDFYAIKNKYLFKFIHCVARENFVVCLFFVLDF